jgi:putative endonuclease
MYTTYVLKSLVNGRLYTGSTNNFLRRFSEHNTGKSKYTRSLKPFIVVHKEEYITRNEAVNRELFLKTGKGRELIKKFLKI